jgi:hypothetical protein
MLSVAQDVSLIEHTFVFAEGHCTEIEERVGERERSFSAVCLSCGWRSPDTRNRFEVQSLAADHEAGRLRPWQDSSGEPGWDSRRPMT